LSNDLGIWGTLIINGVLYPIEDAVSTHDEMMPVKTQRLNNTFVGDNDVLVGFLDLELIEHLSERMGRIDR
jgi:hypothetical protein